MKGVHVLLRMHQRAERYVLNGDTLLQGTKFGLSVVPTIEKREFITKTFGGQQCSGTNINTCSISIAASWQVSRVMQSHGRASRNGIISHFFNGLFRQVPTTNDGKRYTLITVKHLLVRQSFVKSNNRHLTLP